MSTDVLSFNVNITAGEIIELLKEIKPEEKISHYIYVTDQDERLEGVISLNELILSDSNSKVKEIMQTEVIKLSDDEKLDSAIAKFIKYDLITMPVIDVEDKLQGILFINDIIDEMFPHLDKKKLKRAV